MAVLKKWTLPVWKLIVDLSGLYLVTWGIGKVFKDMNKAKSSTLIGEITGK